MLNKIKTLVPNKKKARIFGDCSLKINFKVYVHGVEKSGEYQGWKGGLQGLRPGGGG